MARLPDDPAARRRRSRASAEPPRRLVLLRHGRTAWNHERRVQGQPTSELDDSGRAQAARGRAGASPRCDPVALWTSDLVRARETAAYVAERHRPRRRVRRPAARVRPRRAAGADPRRVRRGRPGGVRAVPAGRLRRRARRRVDAERARPDGRGAAASCSPRWGRARPASWSPTARRSGSPSPALLGWPEDAFRTCAALATAAGPCSADHPATGGLRLAAYNRVAGPGPPADSD